MDLLNHYKDEAYIFVLYCNFAIKNIMRKTLFIIAMAELIAIISLFLLLRSSRNKLELSENNVKAYKTENVRFRMTMRDLQYSNDSIFNECLKIKDSLKIKDRNMKEIIYVPSYITKHDSIVFNDTVFVEGLHLDTVISDKWSSIKLSMDYPCTVEIEPSFESKKVILTSSKRETVNPPRKFFLFRWFQRKHTIITTEVVEENPYIINGNITSVDIIK